MKPTPAAEDPPARKTYDDAADGAGEASEGTSESGFPELPADGDSNFRPTRPREGDDSATSGRTEAFKPTVEEDANGNSPSPAPTGSDEDAVSPNKLPAPPEAENANDGSSNNAAVFGPQLRLTVHRRPMRSRLPIQSVKGRVHLAERSSDVNSEWLPAPVNKSKAASIAAR